MLEGYVACEQTEFLASFISDKVRCLSHRRFQTASTVVRYLMQGACTVIPCFAADMILLLKYRSNMRRERKKKTVVDLYYGGLPVA